MAENVLQKHYVVKKELFLFYRKNNDMLSDGLHLLLSFNLARGHVGGLLRTLKILQGKGENKVTELPCGCDVSLIPLSNASKAMDKKIV